MLHVLLVCLPHVCPSVAFSRAVVLPVVAFAVLLCPFSPSYFYSTPTYVYDRPWPVPRAPACTRSSEHLPVALDPFFRFSVSVSAALVCISLYFTLGISVLCNAFAAPLEHFVLYPPPLEVCE